MKTCNINGVVFNAADGEPSDFGCFSVGDPKATDTAPWGMLEEMKAFIRIQDERRLSHLVDVGALFGVFSLVFTRYPDAEAFAIEPSPWAYPGLAENMKLNPDRDIDVIKAFLGDVDGQTVDCGKEWRHVIAGRKGDGPERYPMISQRLDKIAYIQKCDCLKIDVEGFECPVLRGARGLIDKCRPIILLEAHFSVLPQVSGDTNTTLFELIKELGYKPFTFQGEEVKSFEGVNGHRYVLFAD